MFFFTHFLSNFIDYDHFLSSYHITAVTEKNVHWEWQHPDLA